MVIFVCDLRLRQTTFFPVNICLRNHFMWCGGERNRIPCTKMAPIIHGMGVFYSSTLKNAYNGGSVMSITLIQRCPLWCSLLFICLVLCLNCRLTLLHTGGYGLTELPTKLMLKVNPSEAIWRGGDLWSWPSQEEAVLTEWGLIPS